LIVSGRFSTTRKRVVPDEYHLLARRAKSAFDSYQLVSKKVNFYVCSRLSSSVLGSIRSGGLWADDSLVASEGFCRGE